MWWNFKLFQFICLLNKGWAGGLKLACFSKLSSIGGYFTLFYFFSLLGGQVKEKIGAKKNKGENSITSEIINILNEEVFDF